jgi:NAD(P)-dependent dehydrogenase (short-subunit alcohol dehydrogenase family)
LDRPRNRLVDPPSAGRQYPLGGIQTPEEVAEAMAWLLSSGAARITGRLIAVDGGFTTVRPLVE